MANDFSGHLDRHSDTPESVGQWSLEATTERKRKSMILGFKRPIQNETTFVSQNPHGVYDPISESPISPPQKAIFYQGNEASDHIL